MPEHDWAEGDPAVTGDVLRDAILRIRELEARVGRLQRLWRAWQRAQGYDVGSERFAQLLVAIKACEDAGDLLPLEAGDA